MEEPNFERMVCNCLLAALALIYILFSCCGCNVQKKAEARVLANYESVKTVREKTDALFPCVNDTAFLPVKSDTTISYTPESYSEPSKPMYDDETTNPFYKNPSSFMVHEQAKKLNVSKTITIHDSIPFKVKDVRELNDLKVQLANEEFNKKLAETEMDEWKTKAENRFKALFIVIALFVIGLIIKFYSKNIFSGLKGFITGI
jgi:hypothetical protein